MGKDTVQGIVSSELFDVNLRGIIQTAKPGDRIFTRYNTIQGLLLPRQPWFQEALLSTPFEIGIHVSQGKESVELLIGGIDGLEYPVSDFTIGHTHNFKRKTSCIASATDYTNRSRCPDYGEVIISPFGLFYFTRAQDRKKLDLLFRYIDYKKNDPQQRLHGTWNVHGLAQLGALIDMETYQLFMQRFFGIIVKFEPKPEFAGQLMKGNFFQPFEEYMPTLKQLNKADAEKRLDLLRKEIDHQTQPHFHDQVSTREE